MKGKEMKALAIIFFLWAANYTLAEDILNYEDAPYYQENAPRNRFEEFRLSIGPDFHWFNWQEWNPTGSRLLQETGTFFGLYGELSDYLRPFRLSANLKLVKSLDVVYDGQRQNGEPITTNVDYLGYWTNFNAEVPIHIGEYYVLSPQIGLGMNSWNRDIKGSGGYLEKWFSMTIKPGIKNYFKAQDDSWIYFEANPNFTIYTINTPDILSINLYPNLATWFDFGMGYTTGKWDFNVFYNGLNFKKSDNLELSTQQGRFIVYQPKSMYQAWGLRITYAVM